MVSLLVALLLRTEHQLLLSVEQALSGLRLARHHQLGSEMAGSRVRLGALAQALALNGGRNLLLL